MFDNISYYYYYYQCSYSSSKVGKPDNLISHWTQGLQVSVEVDMFSSKTVLGCEPARHVKSAYDRCRL